MSHDTIKEFFITMGGAMKAKIHRSDGTVEGPWECKNQATSAGLNAVAAMMIVVSGTPYVNVAVGSGTAAGSLGSTALINEVLRKAGATQTTSRSNIILTTTWGGAADSITSIALEEAGIFNSASSGAGTMLNKVTGVNATLADSDILNLEMTFRVGSHGL